VTPGRRISAWIRIQSGCGRTVSAAIAPGGVNSFRSRAVSSSSDGTGQVMPTTAARRRYSATV
jgi:hypothetical protein